MKTPDRPGAAPSDEKSGARKRLLQEPFTLHFPHRRFAVKHRSLLFSLPLLFGSLHSPAAADDGFWDVYADTWVATDGLGRQVPGHETTGPVKPGKTVGIFYFLWLTGKGPVYDLSKILAENPDNPPYGPPGAFHFWSEPLFGYYRGDDPFVIRKHAQMLTDSGVDVLFLDVTNALTYDKTLEKVCQVFTELRAVGQRTPSLAFLANTRAADTVKHLYETFYKPGKYRDLWFIWKGRPLMLAPSEGLPEEIREFFTLRRSWAWTKGQEWFGDGKDKWPWLDNTPQTPGWSESPDKPEQIPVALAQHPITPIGRSFHNGAQPPPEECDPAAGAYFAEQMERALEVDPPVLFITGWNEWVAQRFIDREGTMSLAWRKLKPGDSYFVDQYSMEFSRDAEPMKGGIEDAAWYQVIGGIRRFKGARAVPAVVEAPVKLDGKFDDWAAVEPEFRDTLTDPVKRDHPGWEGQPRFVDTSGRNDLAAAKVTRDASNVYFYLRTRDPLRTAVGEEKIHLLIDADQNARTGWLGYDLAVLTTATPGEYAFVLKYKDGSFEPAVEAAPVRVFSAGNQLELAVSRTLLTAAGGGDSFDFKWTDNIPLGGDASGFTLKGDAAPNDRFNYRARFTATSP